MGRIVTSIQDLKNECRAKGVECRVEGSSLLNTTFLGNVDAIFSGSSMYISRIEERGSVELLSVRVVDELIVVELIDFDDAYLHLKIFSEYILDIDDGYRVGEYFIIRSDAEFEEFEKVFVGHVNHVKSIVFN